jgi:hypothetical protein
MAENYQIIKINSERGRNEQKMYKASKIELAKY